MPVGFMVMVGPERALFGADQHAAFHGRVDQWLNAASPVGEWLGKGDDNLLRPALFLFFGDGSDLHFGISPDAKGRMMGRSTKLFLLAGRVF